MPRRLFVAALLAAAAGPALAGEGNVQRMVCRADNPALLAEPLSLSIDLATRNAVEDGSGAQYGVTVYRDGLGLWDKASGPGSVVYRIDRFTGRFVRVDKQVRLEGLCERAAPKL